MRSRLSRVITGALLTGCLLTMATVGTSSALGAEADLNVHLEAVPGTYAQGPEGVPYRLTITNNGPDEDGYATVTTSFNENVRRIRNWHPRTARTPRGSRARPSVRRPTVPGITPPGSANKVSVRAPRRPTAQQHPTPSRLRSARGSYKRHSTTWIKRPCGAKRYQRTTM
jgi:hypothetical protein